MAESAFRPKLGDILIRLKLVNAEQVEAALEHQARSGKLFGESLLDLGFIAQDDLSWALSSQLELPFVAVTPDMAVPDLVARFPADFLRRNLVLPLVASETSLSVVLADPTDRNTLARLERMAGTDLVLAVGTPAAIRAALRTVLGDEEAAGPSTARIVPLPGRTPPASLSSPELASLVDRALAQGAVLVHLDPEGDEVRVRFRDGAGLVQDGGSMPSEGLRDMVTGLHHWLGAGTVRAPGITAWGESPEQASQLPFRVVGMESESGLCLTLILEGIAPEGDAIFTGNEPEWERFEAAFRRPTGLVVGVAPTASARALLLSGLGSRLAAGGRRVVGMGPATLRLPEDAMRFGREATPSSAAELARLEGIDVIFGSFDDGSLLRELLPAAARDRLVVAAFPGNAALGFLARAVETGISPVLLAETLQAVAALRVLPGSGEFPACTVTETLFVDRPLRAALQNGGAVDALRAAAREQGFLEMAERLRGTEGIDPVALSDLERLRYLEDAA